VGARHARFTATDPEGESLTLASPFATAFGNPAVGNGTTTSLTPTQQGAGVSGILQVTDERQDGTLRDLLHPLRPVRGNLIVPRQVIRQMQLRPGLLLALEPWVMEDTAELITDADGWTLRSATGCRTAHSEHTIAITEDGPEVLTLAHSSAPLEPAVI